MSLVAVVGPITTLLGGLGGYWLAGRNEEARDRRAFARDREARLAALAESLEEQRHTIQLETMLKLQDELLSLVVSDTEGASRASVSLAKGGQSQAHDELRDKNYQASSAAYLLRTRLLDADLRKAVKGYLAASSRIRESVAGSTLEKVTEINRRATEAANLYAALNEQLGEHLRRELDRRNLAGLPPADGQR